MIKLIAFDLDGVLVEAKKVHFEALNASIRYFSDVFFYGKPDVMSRCIPDEIFYTESIINSSLNAEEILDKYLKSKDIKIKNVDDLSYRIRDVDF